MTTDGCHGPSDLDADEWICILTHFGQQSVEISHSQSKIAQNISTEILSHELLEPYNACQLIPFDKNPGVRPIGIGEVIRRKIDRTIITKYLKSEIMVLGSNYQLYLNQLSNMHFVRLRGNTRKQIPME